MNRARKIIELIAAIICPTLFVTIHYNGNATPLTTPVLISGWALLAVLVLASKIEALNLEKKLQQIEYLKQEIRRGVAEIRGWDLPPFEEIDEVNRNEYLDRLGANLEELLGPKAMEAFLTDAWNVGEVARG